MNSLLLFMLAASVIASHSYTIPLNDGADDDSDDYVNEDTIIELSSPSLRGSTSQETLTAASCLTINVLNYGSVPVCGVWRHSDGTSKCYRHVNIPHAAGNQLVISYTNAFADPSYLPDPKCPSMLNFGKEPWIFVDGVDDQSGGGYPGYPFKTPSKAIRGYTTFNNPDTLADEPMLLYITCTGDVKGLLFNQLWCENYYCSVIVLSRSDAPDFCAALDSSKPAAFTRSPSRDKPWLRRGSKHPTVAPTRN